MKQADRLTMDVSGTINVTDSAAVCDAVVAILKCRYPDVDFQLIPRLYIDFAVLMPAVLTDFYPARQPTMIFSMYLM